VQPFSSVPGIQKPAILPERGLLRSSAERARPHSVSARSDPRGRYAAHTAAGRARDPVHEPRVVLGNGDTVTSCRTAYQPDDDPAISASA